MTADAIEVVGVEDGFRFDFYTSAEIINSVLRPAEASFEVGDDGSYDELKRRMAIGQEYRVLVNSRPRLQGRIQFRQSPLDAGQSSTLRMTVRTRIADMVAAAADTRIRLKDLSIKQLVLKATAALGMSESDFIFDPRAVRNVVTGRSPGGAATPKDLAPLKDQAAAVQPGENVKSFIDRHLRRHGLMMWDGPDGRVVVAEPDDDHEELYTFRCLRGAEGVRNNALRIERVEDVTGSPTSLSVFGFGGGKDYQRAKVGASISNAALIAAGFATAGDTAIGFRPALVIDEGVKTAEMARRTMMREYSELVRREDVVAVEVDGLSYKESGDSVPYAIDACAFVAVESLGGSAGRYYIEEVVMRDGPTTSKTTGMTMVRAGSWSL